MVTPHADDHRFTYELSAIKQFESLQNAVEQSNLMIDLSYGAEYTGARETRPMSPGVTPSHSLGLGMCCSNCPRSSYRLRWQYLWPVSVAMTCIQCWPTSSAASPINQIRTLFGLAAGRALVQVSFRSLAGI